MKFLLLLFSLSTVCYDVKAGAGVSVTGKSFRNLYYIGAANNDLTFIAKGLKFNYSESDVNKLGSFFSKDTIFQNKNTAHHFFPQNLLGENCKIGQLNKAFDFVSQKAGTEDAFIFYYNGVLAKLKGNTLAAGTFENKLEGTAMDTSEYNAFLINEKRVESQFTSRWLQNKIDLIPCNNITIIIDVNNADKAAYELMNDLADKNSLLYKLKGKNIRFVYPEGGLIYENSAMDGGDFCYTLVNTAGLGLYNYFFDVAPVLAGKLSTERQKRFEKKQFVYVNDLEQFLAIKEAVIKDVVCEQTSRSTIDEGDKPQNGFGQRKALNYALLVGVDEYDAKENWGKLNNAVNDASTLEKVLKNNFGFETKFLPNPGGDEILQAIADIQQNIKFDSTYSQLFIFIASHGGWDETAPGFIVPKDALPKSKDKFRRSYISLASLRSIISNIDCPHILIAIDACYGGTFDELISKSSRSRDEKSLDTYDAAFVERTLKAKSRLYLTSGGKEKVDDGKPGEHSPFARILLDELNLKYQLHKPLHFDILKGRIIDAQLRPEPRSGTFDSRNHDPGGAFIFVPSGGK